VTFDLVIRAARVVTPEGERPAAVGVRFGQVETVEAFEADLDAVEIVTLAEDEVLLPGLVDTHVHVNEPGRTDWEGFATATRAAAAGGVTTVIDMPLNSVPPTCDVKSLDVKRRSAEGQCFVDVGFWGGAIPGNVGQLRALHDAGVFGFKCFLLPSGVDEFAPLDVSEFAEAMGEMASFDGLMIVHAEDANVIEHAATSGGRSYQQFLESRPPTAESIAINQVIQCLRATGGRAHILHLSAAAALPMIAQAKADDLRLSTETCPHYLSFEAEAIRDGATQFKCCPPIRDAANREALWAGLARDEIDLVVSDHSPCTPDLKSFETGDFAAAWGGIASLQLGLSAVWTQARSRDWHLADVGSRMSRRPAILAGLERKGAIAPGFDADFCVFAPDEKWVVDAGALQQRHAVTPYDGMALTGRARQTWLRGRCVFDGGLASGPEGRLLRRGEA